MRSKLAAATALAALLALSPASRAASPEDVQSAADIHAHMAFLASDLLRGREAGSVDFDIAAAYVASQMEQLGLKPMGGNGKYLQPVPLLSYRAADQGALALKDAQGKERQRQILFSSKFACPVSGFTIPEIEPRLFSFNNPHGACPECDGLGTQNYFDEALVVPDESLSLKKGAVAP